MAQLLSNLPYGAKVKFGKWIQRGTRERYDIKWHIVAKNHSGYPSNSVTLHSVEGLQRVVFDAKESSNTAYDYSVKGNCTYKLSNVRQWMNSRANDGGWYTSQHDRDKPPTSSYVDLAGDIYNTDPGFLNAFTDDEYNKILETTIKVAKSAPEGGGSENVVDKLFLPSKAEVGLGSENNISEGSVWYYYNDGSGKNKRGSFRRIHHHP